MKINKLTLSLSSIMLATAIAYPTYAVDLTQLNQQKDKLVQEINQLKSEEQTLVQTSVGITILKENQSDISIMQNYILSPADAQLQTDGSYLVHLTIKDPSYWKSLVINGVDAMMISENGDTAVVEFTVATLTELATVSSHIVVPSVNYDNNYVTYLQFDTNDATKLKMPKDDKLVALNVELEKINQQIEQAEITNKTIDKEEMTSELHHEQKSSDKEIKSQSETKKSTPQSPKNKLSMPIFVVGVVVPILVIGAWLMRKKRKR